MARADHRSMYGNQYDERRTGCSGRTFVQPLKNHIVFAIDGSSSMDGHTKSVVKVIEDQIAYLARRSQEMEQETRVSVYVFADGVQCLVQDVDVLRLPSIGDLYEPYGNTALIAATMQALDDLEKIPTTYGDHSSLVYVITDGQENASFDKNGYRYARSAVSKRLEGLPDNVTVALLAPDILAKQKAVDWGFPRDNVAIWDNTSRTGMDQVETVVTAATENYFAGRARGQRGSRNIFSTGADAVNKATVQAALTPLPGDKYRLIPVVPAEGTVKDEKGQYPKIRVDKFIREDCGMKFQLGTVFYQWNKREKVQPQKQLAVVEKATDKVYTGTGDEIRRMIGLPDMSVTQKADPNPKYDIFVQSTAPNRNLVAHTKVLVML